MLSDGSLHYSYAADAWVPVNSTVQITPVRVIDTVTGAGGITGPLVPGGTVHTSSIIAGTNGIPASATGIVGNFAISGVNGALLNGYGVATIFPAGAATPATASINAGNGCFADSNGVSVGFGLGGRVSMVWNGGGARPPCARVSRCERVHLVAGGSHRGLGQFADQAHGSHVTPDFRYSRGELGDTAADGWAAEQESR